MWSVPVWSQTNARMGGPVPPGSTRANIGEDLWIPAAAGGQSQALKISFAFVTGHSSESAFPAQFARRPFLTKPYAQDALLALLKSWRALG